MCKHLSSPCAACSFIAGRPAGVTNDKIPVIAETVEPITTFFNGSFLDVPFYLLAVAGAYSRSPRVFLHLTIYGRYFYAIGSNERAARYSGINIEFLQDSGLRTLLDVRRDLRLDARGQIQFGVAVHDRQLPGTLRHRRRRPGRLQLARRRRHDARHAHRHGDHGACCRTSPACGKSPARWNRPSSAVRCSFARSSTKCSAAAWTGAISSLRFAVCAQGGLAEIS